MEKENHDPQEPVLVSSIYDFLSFPRWSVVVDISVVAVPDPVRIWSCPMWSSSKPNMYDQIIWGKNFWTRHDEDYMKFIIYAKSKSDQILD